MNYIEREIEGLKPDVALVGAMPERREIYDYMGRLLRALEAPPLVHRPTGIVSMSRTRCRRNRLFSGSNRLSPK